MTPHVYAILATAIVSLVSLSGVGLLSLGEARVRQWLTIFVSFSTGALLGNVLLHMLPEMAENAETFHRSLMIMLGGIVASFVIEKMIHWHHCHHVDHHHVHPVGILTLIGDGLHNIVDGMLIGSTFLISIPLGISTTLAVALHEIPQEIGDFSILLHSGFTRSRALLLNLLSACTAIGGAMVVLLTYETFPNIIDWILPFAAGNLLYIAGVDLLPELHKEARFKEAVLQLLALVAGIGVLSVLSANTEHAHEEEVHSTDHTVEEDGHIAEDADHEQ